MMNFIYTYQPLFDYFLLAVGFAYSQQMVLRAGVFSIGSAGFASIGATPKGGVRRLTLTDVDKLARDRFRTECEAMGLTVTFDVVGRLSLAFHQNGVAPVGGIEIRHRGTVDLQDLNVRVVADLRVAAPPCRPGSPTGLWRARRQCPHRVDTAPPRAPRAGNRW